MNVDGDALVEITQAVWGSFVDPELALVDLSAVPLDSDWRGVVIGSVDISGSLPRRVRVAMPRRAASEAAARMFDVDPASLLDADVHDAAGELTNMIGGNVKAMLTGKHQLGLPSVTASDVPGPAEAALASATLLWGEHTLLVTFDTASGGTP